MKIIDVKWTPSVNIFRIKCDCQYEFDHRADRWKVKCKVCNRVSNIEPLRNEFVRRIEWIIGLDPC